MADKSVFSRLKRLFSTDVVIRNVGGNQIKVIDSAKIQSTGELETNSLMDRYNRVFSTSPSSLYGAQFNMNYQYLRPQLYSEYDLMDNDAIIASALDVLADESTLKNDMGEVLQIKSADEDIQKILYNLFYDVLNVEFNLWPWIRNMCKYGDFFLKLEIAEKFGVYNVIPYTAFHIERIEGETDEGYYQRRLQERQKYKDIIDAREEEKEKEFYKNHLGVNDKKEQKKITDLKMKAGKSDENYRSKQIKT